MSDSSGSCGFVILTSLTLPMEICSLSFDNGTVLAAASWLMPFPLVLLLLYCAMIAVSSLCGGVLPTLVRLTHTRMQILVSLIGGLMLGVGIFHQLPHAVAVMPVNGADVSPALDSCMRWLMFGLLLTFFMQRLFHSHTHEPTELTDDHSHDCSHDHEGHHSHDHDHDHEHTGAVKSAIKTSWFGIFVGLSIHTILDGVALAAHVEADALHNHGTGVVTLLGLGTFLGVVLHKPLDSLAITSLMAGGGWSRRWMVIVNFCYAWMCPIGAAVFYFGTRGQGEMRDFVVAAALAMSAGIFICISLSDLLPEVQFHSHDRLWLSAALLIGVGAAWAIGLVEPAHTHDHSNVPAVQQSDYGHPN